MCMLGTLKNALSMNERWLVMINHTVCARQCCGVVFDSCLYATMHIIMLISLFRLSACGTLSALSWVDRDVALWADVPALAVWVQLHGMKAVSKEQIRHMSHMEKSQHADDVKRLITVVSADKVLVGPASRVIHGLWSDYTMVPCRQTGMHISLC